MPKMCMSAVFVIAGYLTAVYRTSVYTTAVYMYAVNLAAVSVRQFYSSTWRLETGKGHSGRQACDSEASHV